MKKYILLAMVFALSFLAFRTDAQTAVQPGYMNYCFISNMSFGVRGEHVAMLQRLLNSNEETTVALTGPGSRGNETTYFGAATRAAVVRFQMKYAADVLQPYGLKSGTGFVGISTRAKLNSMSGCGQIPNPQTGQIQLNSISPTVGVKGTVVTLTGTFPTTGNTVKFDEYVAAANVSSNGTSLTFTVPEGGGVYCAPGLACIQIYKIFGNASYQVSVANGNLTSNSRVFTIGTPPQVAISVLSPGGGEYWTRNTIQNIHWVNNLPPSTSANPSYTIKLLNIPPACPSSTPCMYAVPAPYVIVNNVTGQNFSWNVGTNVDGTRTISPGIYKVQVCTTDGTTCGEMNSPFTIQ